MSKFIIQSFSFAELIASPKADFYIKIVEKIAESLLKKNGSNGLKDKINYREFIFNDYSKMVDFGRIFLAQELESSEYVGFLLSLHDNKVKAKKAVNKNTVSFPINHCDAYFEHDTAYLEDLIEFENFAYCFQLGIKHNYQRNNCGNELLDAYEIEYGIKQQKTLLAASIHEDQRPVMELLKKRNTSLDRHNSLTEGKHKDFFNLFIDHYFDTKETQKHWFRVIQILDNKKFVSSINPYRLSKTYNTVIPIQLNQAIININRIIRHLDAKVTWSSFFNGSELLIDSYNMNRDNHSFFTSLLDAKNKKSYLDCSARIRAITSYLKQKETQSEDVISLTQNFKEHSFQIFFFDDQEHEMESFINPIYLSLKQPLQAIRKLLFSKHIRKQGVEKLSTEQKKNLDIALTNRALVKTLPPESDKDKETEEERVIEWNKWKKQLLLSEEENEILIQGQRDFLKHLIEGYKTSNNKQELSYSSNEDLKRLKESFKKQKRFVSSALVDKWEAFIKLHNTLYEVDKTTMKSPQDYWWCHGMVPINYSRGSNVVGVMFSFYCKKLNPADTEYTTRMNNIAYLVSNALSRNMLNILIKLQEKDSRTLSERYSLAAVTSRNLAHNIGSHVLPNLNTKEELNQLSEYYDYDDDIFHKNLALFNSFLRIRTILIADMVTNEPVTSVNKWLNKEVLKTFNEQKILKRYITGTNISNVDVHFRDINDNDKKDIQVQIPNGDLGMSAFFMLLENIIRNTAKYEQLDETKQALNIYVKVDSKTDTQGRGYFLILSDHIKREEKKLNLLIEKINKSIKKRDIKLGSKIESSGWGLMEMKAAAAYLRKKAPGTTIGSGEKMLTYPLLEAIKTPVYSLKDEQKFNSLAYRIYLKTPRNIIIIDHKNDFQRTNIKRTGIKLLTINSLVESDTKIHSHDIVICFNKRQKEAIKKEKRFPLRWVYIENNTEYQDLIDNYKNTEKEDDEFLYQIWLYWIKKYCKNKGIDYHNSQVCILDNENTKNLLSITEKQIEISNPNKLYIYDSHARSLPLRWQQSDQAFGFYQSFGSLDHTGRIVYNANSLNVHQREILKIQFLEAAITRVLVIDERIQRSVISFDEDNKKQQDISHFDRLEKMLIHIPNPSKNEPSLLSIHKLSLIEEWLNSMLEKDFKVDFIIIHLGLLESLLGSDMKTIARWVKKVITSKDKRPEVILTSGRGKPYQFPDSILFQSSTNISEYIVEGKPSKFHFVQNLFSSRTRVGIHH